MKYFKNLNSHWDILLLLLLQIVFRIEVVWKVLVKNNHSKLHGLGIEINRDSIKIYSWKENIYKCWEIGVYKLPVVWIPMALLHHKLEITRISNIRFLCLFIMYSQSIYRFGNCSNKVDILDLGKWIRFFQERAFYKETEVNSE